MRRAQKLYIEDILFYTVINIIKNTIIGEIPLSFMILFSNKLSNNTLTLNLTFSRPGSQGAVVIDEVVESEWQDEEGAVTRHVHLEGHIPLV